VPAVREIVDRLTNPDPRQKVMTLSLRGTGWDSTPLPALVETVARVAGGLRKAGVRPGEPLPIIAETPLSALVSFLGAQGAGAWPALLPPTSQFRDLSGFAPAVFEKARKINAARLLGATAQIAFLPPNDGIEILGIEALSVGVPGPFTDNWPGHLQFTSGSTGPAKAISIPPSALSAQVAALQERLDWTSALGTSFWLPWYHDMGLIGGMLAPLMIGCNMQMMAPWEFVRNPLRFLETLGSGGAALTAMPPFGLRLLMRRLERGTGGPDLSAVHAMIIGAEPIPATLLSQAETMFADLALRPGRLLPAYGLAETVLAATLPRPGDRLLTARDMNGDIRLACGEAVTGIELRIADDDGEETRSGNVGEILLRGQSLAAPMSHDGWYHTGDAAFRDGALLFPVGRFGDAVKIRGTYLFAEDAERRLVDFGLRHDQFVVVYGLLGSLVHALLVTWGPVPDKLEGAMDILRGLTEGGVVLHVSVAGGAVLRTSSGKVRRNDIWNEYRRKIS
jgi:acyl-CoA synthetase (AMP-forming)/AMP-acid ligase II